MMVKANLVLCLSAAAWLSSPVAAQTPYPAGQTDVLWTNTSGMGTAILDARVHYPAAVAGVDTAPAANASGWPTLVFAHGFAVAGTDYDLLGQRMAENGYISVMLNTAVLDPAVLTDDVHATYDEILTANAATGTLLEGAFDITRIGVYGHSMGGAVTCYAVFESPGNPLHNPGYKCAFSISPLDPGTAAADVIVPYGIISGEGDTVTPAGPNADVLYATLDLEAGVKFHYHFGLACDHLNVVGISTTPPEIFDRTISILVGFFDEFLVGTDHGLEGALGPASISDPNLMTLDQEWYSVRTWIDQGLQIGQTTRMSVATGNGVCGFVNGNTLAPAPFPTPFGDLLVDVATSNILDVWITLDNRHDLLLPLPMDPGLVGITLAVQGFGTTVFDPNTLALATDAVLMTVAP